MVKRKSDAPGSAGRPRPQDFVPGQPGAGAAQWSSRGMNTKLSWHLAEERPARRSKGYCSREVWALVGRNDEAARIMIPATIAMSARLKIPVWNGPRRSRMKSVTRPFRENRSRRLLVPPAQTRDKARKEDHRSAGFLTR